MFRKYMIPIVFATFCIEYIRTEDINNLYQVEVMSNKEYENNIINGFEPNLNINEKQQHAENCKCKNGKCVNKGGKLVCTCASEYGVYAFGSVVECRACECGKDSNCTMDVTFWKTTINCICKEGYRIEKNFCQGTCTKNPCKNGGTCADVNKTFKCICPDGYSGKLCETKSINPCSSSPCLNGAKCNANGQNYNCSCVGPFSGSRCEIGPCSKNPCLNGGMCNVTGNTFNCTCKEPFSGLKCEIGPCSKNPCQNGGTCNVMGTSFKCSCKIPFSGTQCEIGPCSKNPCQNGGTCNVIGTSFKCSCTKPFSGLQCEIGPCSKNPCQNGGICNVMGTSFKCSCKIPFSGLQCEIGPCLKNPCQNGGTCSVMGASFKCTCKTPFKGPQCNIDPCSSGPCLNEGVCSVVGIDFKCACKSTYSGRQCELVNTTESPRSTSIEDTTILDDCNCGINSLNCYFYRGKKLCKCKETYAQKNGACRKTCQFNSDCLNGGSCRIYGTRYFCQCPDVYLGDRCQVDVCRHIRLTCVASGATCKRQGNAGICQCPEGKALSRSSGMCEDACNYDSCVHGFCKIIEGIYKCVCNDGFKGRHCDEKITHVIDAVPFSTLILILFVGNVVFALAAIIAICWVKRLNGKLLHN